MKIGTKVYYQHATGRVEGTIVGVGEKNGMTVYDVELDTPIYGSKSFWGYKSQFTKR